MNWIFPLFYPPQEPLPPIGILVLFAGMASGAWVVTTLVAMHWNDSRWVGKLSMKAGFILGLFSPLPFLAVVVVDRMFFRYLHCPADRRAQEAKDNAPAKKEAPAEADFVQRRSNTK